MRDCKRQVDLINDRSCVFVCIYLYMVHFLCHFSSSQTITSIHAVAVPVSVSLSQHERYRRTHSRSHHQTQVRHMRWPSRRQHQGGYEGSEAGHGTCSVTFRQVIKLTPILETIVPLAEGQLL